MNTVDRLLLLTHRYDADSQCIWRAALKAGWRTERIGPMPSDIARRLIPKPDICAYFGNMLHYEAAKTHLPTVVSPIPNENLTLLPQFTGRQIRLMEASRLGVITQPTFIKCPWIKWTESRVYKPGESPNCKPDDMIYVQPVVKFGKEIRCFVLNGEILTASYYRNAGHEFYAAEIKDISDDVREMARAIYDQLPWPRGVVFDFGWLDDGRLVFIEPNEAPFSGVYDCDPDAAFEVICAAQEKRA